VPTYAVDLTAIVQLSPDFVLLDGYFTGSAEDFSALLGDDSIHVFKMNKTWNSYCPDATVGLWTVASLFYPQYFDGEVPLEPSDDGGDDNTMLYLAVGAVVVLVVVVAVVFLRRGNK
jgi:hypothetical protein